MKEPISISKEDVKDITDKMKDIHQHLLDLLNSKYKIDISMNELLTMLRSGDLYDNKYNDILDYEKYNNNYSLREFLSDMKDGGIYFFGGDLDNLTYNIGLEELLDASESEMEFDFTEAFSNYIEESANVGISILEKAGVDTDPIIEEIEAGKIHKIDEILEDLPEDKVNEIVKLIGLEELNSDRLFLYEIREDLYAVRDLSETYAIEE